VFLLLCLFQSSFGTFIAINLNDKLPKHCRMVPETHVRRRKRLRGEDDSKSSNTPFSQSDRRRNSNPPHQKYDPLAKNYHLFTLQQYASLGFFRAKSNDCGGTTLAACHFDLSRSPAAKSLRLQLIKWYVQHESRFWNDARRSDSWTLFCP
jgi:hypothetical protein